LGGGGGGGRCARLDYLPLRSHPFPTLQELGKLRSRVDAAASLLAERSAYERAAHRQHRLALTTMALAAALERPAPATYQVAAVKVAGEGDAVVGKALSLLPADVHSVRGVPTLASLQTRYWKVADAIRVAAVVPEGTGAVGQVLGTATNALLIEGPTRSMDSYVDAAAVARAKAAAGVVERPPAPPSPAPLTVALNSGVQAAWSTVAGWFGANVAPSVPNTDDIVPAEVKQTVQKAVATAADLRATTRELTTDIERVHAIVEHASAAVATGDLAAAITHLSQVGGSGGEAARDWIRAARLRIATDDAASLLRARAAVLTAALY